MCLSGGTVPRILNPGSAFRRKFTTRLGLCNYCVRSAVKLAEPDTVQKLLLSVPVENVTPGPRSRIQYHFTDWSIHMKVNSYENKSQIFYIILFLCHSSFFFSNFSLLRNVILCLHEFWWHTCTGQNSLKNLGRKVKIARDTKSKAKVLWYMKDDYPREFTERLRDNTKSKAKVLWYMKDD